MTEAVGARRGEAASGDTGMRAKVQGLLESGARDAAIQSARTLLAEQPGARTLRFLRRLAESDAASGAGLKPFRIALLSSFSIEFIQDPLVAQGFLNGLRLELRQAGFGAFRQELLDPASELYAAPPDLVILAVEGEEWAPAAYAWASQDGAADAAAVVEGFRAEFASLIDAFRARCSAPLLVHNFAPPPALRLGILDAGDAEGQSRLVDRLNDALRSASAAAAAVYVVDYAALVRQHGTRQWYDQRMRHYARAPIAQPMLTHLAREYLKFVRCLVGFNKKCLVLDLDNTVWGGVVGEEGVDGIHLGPTYPGSAFLEFQQYVLALRQRGVILAVASKNNPADVDEVFARHRHMALRKEHFAEMQVHWEPKSESLRRLAANLDIGLEHMVLVDDNPAECEQVRGALPMVTVVQLPAQPERYIEALHEEGWFDALAVSSEDLRRGELYQQRAEAEALRTSGVSLDEYYQALDMEFRVAPVDRSSLKRAAQLTQKTNQLNVTTRRYSEAQLAELMADPRWCVRTVTVTDRFGDNGIVGIIMGRAEGEALHIDNLLLSCRVIGRGVEAAMLAYLCEAATERGLAAVTGELIPTAKNVPVRKLFEENGFTRTAEDAAGTSFWRVSLPGEQIKWPEWFRVVRGAG
jgi:FkbH-like protein